MSAYVEHFAMLIAPGRIVEVNPTSFGRVIIDLDQFPSGLAIRPQNPEVHGDDTRIVLAPYSLETPNRSLVGRQDL